MTSMKAAPWWAMAALTSGTSCFLSPEKLRATKVAPIRSARLTVSMAASLLVGALLRLDALVGGGGELALGEAVDAVVLEDVGHVHAAAHDVGELAEADRGGVAVAGDADVDELAVGEVGAGEDRGHAAVHGVEAVRLAEEVVRGLRAAADAGELGDAVRLDVELVERLDQRGGDRVVPAAGAQGADLALVVAAGEAELVLRQAGVVELGLGEVGHLCSAFCSKRLLLTFFSTPP